MGLWSMRQHSGSIVSMVKVKKISIKIKKKNITKKVLHAVESTQQCNFKLLNTKIRFDFFYLLPLFESLPGIHLPGSRDELQLKHGDDSHAELTDTQCFKQLQVGVHSSCKASAVLSLWLLLADPGSSCYVLRVLQICSGVLL